VGEYLVLEDLVIIIQMCEEVASLGSVLTKQNYIVHLDFVTCDQALSVTLFVLIPSFYNVFLLHYD
jgi:hypothetical protein